MDDVMCSNENIPFNKPYLTGGELINIEGAYKKGQLAGDGVYTKACSFWLEQKYGCVKALLTHSCTAALEMSALLIDAGQDDEIIMPSYTFVSTANAFALRGARPVFVDVCENSMNINVELIEKAITKKTKAIVVVHYGGFCCDMDRLQYICDKYNLILIEDAAQSFGSSYKGKLLGTFGDIACLSFHETKNVISGEGGAILINNKKYTERAEVIREKGTNRSSFFRGEIDKYNWCDVGSSYLPGELIAAFLLAQLENSELITEKRKKIWVNYHDALIRYEEDGIIKLQKTDSNIDYNGHLFYILFQSELLRDGFISFMKTRNISCVFHYVPLHTSKFGMEVTRSSGELEVTNSLWARLVRLPLWLDDLPQNTIIEAVIVYLDNIKFK